MTFPKLRPARNRNGVTHWKAYLSDKLRQSKSKHPHADLCQAVFAEIPVATLHKRRAPAKVEALRMVCELSGQGLVFEQAWRDALGVVVV